MLVQITTKKRTGYTIAIIKILEKQFDASMASDFKHKLDKLVCEEKQQYIIDLTQVEFMDSTALGAMIAFYNKLKRLEENKNNAFFKIVVQPSAVKELLTVTKLDLLFPLFDTLDNALVS